MNFLIPQENLICKQVVLQSLSFITMEEFVTVVPCLSKGFKANVILEYQNLSIPS